MHWRMGILRLEIGRVIVAVCRHSNPLRQPHLCRFYENHITVYIWYYVTKECKADNSEKFDYIHCSNKNSSLIIWVQLRRRACYLSVSHCALGLFFSYSVVFFSLLYTLVYNSFFVFWIELSCFGVQLFCDYLLVFLSLILNTIDCLVWSSGWV